MPRIVKVALGLERCEKPDTIRQHTCVDYLRDGVLRLKHHAGCEVSDACNNFDLQLGDLRHCE